MEISKVILRISLPLFILLTIAPEAAARQCTAVASGAWLTAGTWSCGSAPAGGDTLRIPADVTVTITSNLSYGAPIMVIVDGTWAFNGGGSKISLACGSYVIVNSGGRITGNTSGSSQTIKICGTTYWSASMGDVNGPAAYPYNPLPVELIGFSCAAGAAEVAIRWSTGSESGSESFRIERSADGAIWQTVLEVPAAGWSQGLLEYSVIDGDVPLGDWFYRLRQVDLDGSSELSAVQHVAVKAEGSRLLAVPNPVADAMVSVRCEWAFLPVGPIAVLYMDGKPYRMVPHELAIAGFRIDARDFPSGYYLLTWSDVGGRMRSLPLAVAR